VENTIYYLRLYGYMPVHDRGLVQWPSLYAGSVCDDTVAEVV